MIESVRLDIKAEFLDSKIWFKNFDIAKRNDKSPLTIDLFKPLYSFNIADIYVLSGTMIIVGKTKMLGKAKILSPFAIYWKDDAQLKQTKVKYIPKLIGIEILENDLQIKFQDEEYANSITLVIKRIGSKVYESMKTTNDSI